MMGVKWFREKQIITFWPLTGSHSIGLKRKEERRSLARCRWGGLDGKWRRRRSSNGITPTLYRMCSAAAQRSSTNRISSREERWKEAQNDKQRTEANEARADVLLETK